MKKIDNLSDLIILHDIIEKSTFFQSISYRNGTVEIQLKNEISSIIDSLDEAKIEYEQSGSRVFEIEIEKDQVLFFTDKISFYDRLNTTDLSIINKNIFIWNFDESCLLYENFTIEDALVNKSKSGDFIANVVQYKAILALFLDSNHQLIELDRAHPQNELYISSKGDEKLLVKLTYQKIVENLYSNKFEFLDLEKFSERIKNEEWLACFKNTVCAFFEQQTESKRTFLWLYDNFAYLFANTEKSYLLYVSKFSFDNVSRQFKKDREHYFNNLNEYQNKLSGQLISIPLTIGAALLSNNFVTSNGLASNSVMFLISAYVVFVMGTIGFVLADLLKLKNDIQTESDVLRNLYPNIYDNFKADFTYILRKSRFMIGFAWFLLLLFIIVLFIVWWAPISPSPKDVLFT